MELPMFRQLAAVIAACLVVPACASSSTHHPAALAAGSGWSELRIAPEVPTEAELDLGTGSAEIETPLPGDLGREPAAASRAGHADRAGDAAEPAHAAMASAGPHRHITLLGGLRRMEDDDDWDPVEEQSAAGIMFDWTDRDTGHGFEFGVGASWDERTDFAGLDYEGDTVDVYGGYRYTFFADSGWFHPYLGAGLTFIRGEVKLTNLTPPVSEDDTSGGAYARAGVGFDLGDSVRMGIDYRHSYLTDVELGPIEDVNFGQWSLTLGYGF